MPQSHCFFLRRNYYYFYYYYYYYYLKNLDWFWLIKKKLQKKMNLEFCFGFFFLFCRSFFFITTFNENRMMINADEFRPWFLLPKKKFSGLFLFFFIPEKKQQHITPPSKRINHFNFGTRIFWSKNDYHIEMKRIIML